MTIDDIRLLVASDESRTLELKKTTGELKDGMHAACAFLNTGPITAEAIKAAQKLKARRYRNRRLGDFLKELDLTEGRATGIPTIQKALKDNGSSPAVIETDEDRSYFLMTIPCRDGFAKEVVNAFTDAEDYIGGGLRRILGHKVVQVQEYMNQSVITDKAQLGQLLEQLFVQVWSSSRFKDNALGVMAATIDLLCLLKEGNLSANDLSVRLDYASTKDLKRKIILPLMELEYIAMTIPDKPTSAKQAYKLTSKGNSLFSFENL